MLTREYFLQLDTVDPLATFRDRFYTLPNTIYLDGNSLGLLSREAEASVLQAIHAWKSLGIDGWTNGGDPWFWIGERLGALQADLVGGLPDEIVVTGSTTVNLHALVSTFYRPTSSRHRIVTEAANFPSDLYALQSQVRAHGFDAAEALVLVPADEDGVTDEDDLIAAMDAEVALLWCSAVNYKSGQLLDIERLTREAHARGIVIGVDLAHSAGIVPHRLHDWNVDCATWCTYKYLNGGPGATGSLFVHQRHFGTVPGLAGWWGSAKDRQFDMSTTFIPAPNAGGWQIGTPSVLGSAALYGALAVAHEAGIERIRAKSLAQTDLLIDLIDQRLRPFGFATRTPGDHSRRGGHVAIEHVDGARFARALKARGVIPDFRPPNIVRFAPVPLYTRYVDVWDAVAILAEIASTDAHLVFTNERGVVA